MHNPKIDGIAEGRRLKYEISKKDGDVTLNFMGGCHNSMATLPIP